MIDMAGLDDATASELKAKMLARHADLLKQKAAIKRRLKKASKDAINPKDVEAPIVHSKFADLQNDRHARRLVNDVDLTEPEFRAVRRFTGDGSSKMNEQTLKGDIKASHRALDRGLEKCPGYDGTSARGSSYLPKEQWDKWTSGEWAKVEWKCHSSMSIKPGREFGSTQGVCFIVKNKGKQGRWVMDASAVRGEHELMAQRNSQFRVVGYATSEKGVGVRKHKRILIIEEVDDTIPESQLKPVEHDAVEVWREYEESAREAGVEGISTSW
jgi:hypothetical protein